MVSSLRTVEAFFSDIGIDLGKEGRLDLLVNRPAQVREAVRVAWSSLPQWSFLGRLEAQRVEAMLSALAHSLVKTSNQKLNREEAIAVHYVRPYALLSRAEVDQGEDFLNVLAELGVVQAEGKLVRFSEEIFLSLFLALSYLEPQKFPSGFKAGGGSGEASLKSLWAPAVLVKIALTDSEKQLSVLEMVADRDIHLAALYLSCSRVATQDMMNSLSRKLLEKAQLGMAMEAIENLTTSMVGLGPGSGDECRIGLRTYGIHLPRLLVAVRGLEHSGTSDDLNALRQIMDDDDLGWAELKPIEKELADVESLIAPSVEITKARAAEAAKQVGLFAFKAGVGFLKARSGSSFGSATNWNKAKDIASNMPTTPPLGGNDWLQKQDELAQRRGELLKKVLPLRNQIPILTPIIKEAAKTSIVSIEGRQLDVNAQPQA